MTKAQTKSKVKPDSPENRMVAKLEAIQELEEWPEWQEFKQLLKELVEG